MLDDTHEQLIVIGHRPANAWRAIQEYRDSMHTSLEGCGTAKGLSVYIRLLEARRLFARRSQVNKWSALRIGTIYPGRYQVAPDEAQRASGQSRTPPTGGLQLLAVSKTFPGAWHVSSAHLL